MPTRKTRRLVLVLVTAVIMATSAGVNAEDHEWVRNICMWVTSEKPSDSLCRSDCGDDYELAGWWDLNDPGHSYSYECKSDDGKCISTETSNGDGFMQMCQQKSFSIDRPCVQDIVALASGHKLIDPGKNCKDCEDKNSCKNCQNWDNCTSDDDAYSIDCLAVKYFPDYIKIGAWDMDKDGGRGAIGSTGNNMMGLYIKKGFGDCVESIQLIASDHSTAPKSPEKHATIGWWDVADDHGGRGVGQSYQTCNKDRGGHYPCNFMMGFYATIADTTDHAITVYPKKPLADTAPVGDCLGDVVALTEWGQYVKVDDTITWVTWKSSDGTDPAWWDSLKITHLTSLNSASHVDLNFEETTEPVPCTMKGYPQNTDQGEDTNTIYYRYSATSDGKSATVDVINNTSDKIPYVVWGTFEDASENPRNWYYDPELDIKPRGGGPQSQPEDPPRDRRRHSRRDR